jgi:hypothetical protein
MIVLRNAERNDRTIAGTKPARILLSAILLLVWQVASASAAENVVIDATSSAGTGDNVSVVELRWMHTTGAGFNRVLIVGVSTANQTTPVSGDRVLSVTYAGIGLTRLGTSVTPAPDFHVGVEMFLLIAPPTGTAEIVVSFGAAGITSAVGGAVSFTGVCQCTSTGPFTAGSSLTNSPSLAVPSALGEVVMDTVAMNPSAGFLAAGSNQTERWNGSQFFSFAYEVGAGSTRAGASPNASMSWLSSSNPWSQGAVSVKPAPVIRSFDFDGDFRADVSVWRPSDGRWLIRKTSNNTQDTTTWGLGSLGDKPVPADYDGDGKTDFAVWRGGEGNWYILKSSDGGLLLYGWGSGTLGDRPVPADYDGDGKADVAVFRPSEGDWYIRNSSNGSITVRGWGTPTDKPVPADYDGDGKADVAVWRSSDGNWYIINSSNNTATIKQWGISTDQPVPGDYDGDGKSDIAVWRPNDGTWFIVGSCHGTTTVRGWGSVSLGDLAVPADYDGDGKTDIAVWRAGEGNWYVINSSDGSVTLLNLGGGGDMPVPSVYSY